MLQNILIRQILIASALSLLCTGFVYVHGGKASDGSSAQTDAVQNTGIYENTGEADFKAPQPGTYKLPPIKPAGDGNVITH